jgi:Spy/CpxP family protein refolding chaperone
MLEEKMRLRIYIAFAILLFVAAGAGAQQPAQQPDPIGENLFPPELVMQYQQAISLTEEQKNLIKAEILKAQPRFTELQWQLQSEAETLAGLLKAPKSDEQQVLAQLDKILALEREIKRTQFTLAVRIKNSLTLEQKARLHELKNRQRPQPQE